MSKYIFAVVYCLKYEKHKNANNSNIAWLEFLNTNSILDYIIVQQIKSNEAGYTAVSLPFNILLQIA